jgi:oligoribonuclease (3'-5' exoribonuclease)
MISAPLKFIYYSSWLNPSSQEEVHKVEMKGSYSSTEKPTGISEHLKLVSVKYNVVDDRVLQLLKFMCTFNIRKLTGNSSHAFNFLIFCNLPKCVAKKVSN